MTAIASKEKPLSVSEYAEAAGVSRTTVRRAIRNGFLATDPKAKRVAIVGGGLPLSQYEWQNRVACMLGKFSKNRWGFDDHGNLHLISGANLVVIDRVKNASILPIVKKQIDSISP